MLTRSRAGARGRRAGGQPAEVRLDQAGSVALSTLDEAVVRRYRRMPYPAVLVGAAGGPVTYLAAALGAPVLPQTTPVAVRVRLPEDPPVAAMSALAPTVRRIAAANPGVTAHHRYDPLGEAPPGEIPPGVAAPPADVAAVWLKRRGLGRAYERFVEERLAPGGTILPVVCALDWPVRTLGDRACFQYGGPGGTEEPAQSGTLPPQTDVRRPEAEWGYDPGLDHDAAALSQAYDFPVWRVECGDPQDLSPLVADLYRWWYARTSWPTHRLLVSTAPPAPEAALRAGFVPYWLRAGTRSAHDRLREYLEATEPYDEIRLNLPPRAQEPPGAPGTVTTDEWQELLRHHARRRARLAPERADHAQAGHRNGHRNGRRPGNDGLAPAPGATVPPPTGGPAPLSVDLVAEFLRHAHTRYPVTWREPD